MRALSAAEEEIKRYLLAGLAYKEIAARRGTSIRTINQQVASIYRKYNLPWRGGRLALLDSERRKQP